LIEPQLRSIMLMFASSCIQGDLRVKNKTFRSYLIMIISALIIGCGVGFVVYAALGADSMTTFENGLSVSLNIKLSLSALLANLLFLCLLFFADRKRVSIDTLLCPLFISAGVQLFLMVIPAVTAMALRVLYMAVGITVVGVGIGIGAQSETGSNPYDGFILALSEKVGKPYRIMRPICDSILLIAGILMKGSWGIGTIIAILFQGTIAQFFIGLFRKLMPQD